MKDFVKWVCLNKNRGGIDTSILLNFRNFKRCIEVSNHPSLSNNVDIF